MPRARNIKPSFFKDAKIVSCSLESRLLFQGLWCLADYMGRLKYVPIEIKMEVFPADNIDVEKHMQELAEKELIEIYHDCSGAALVQVRGFSKHQNPHINERQGRDKKPLPCLPSAEECKETKKNSTPSQTLTQQQFQDVLVLLRERYQSDRADSLLLIPDSLLLLLEENNIADESALVSEYAFEGENFRINQKDFLNHQKIYPNLDLLQEYQQLDIEVRDIAQKQRWGAVNAKLNYRNKNTKRNQPKLSSMEAALRHNADYAAQLEREIEQESLTGNDQAMAVPQR